MERRRPRRRFGPRLFRQAQDDAIVETFVYCINSVILSLSKGGATHCAHNAGEDAGAP
jgi:hypothetical protein